MTEATAPVPAAAAPAPVSPAAFAMPTTNEQGQPLSARETLEALRRDPEWTAAALRPNTAARKQLDELNVKIVEEQTGAEQRAADPATAAPPGAAPTDYRLPLVYDGTIPDAEFQRIDSTTRQWLHAGGFSADLGSSLAMRVEELGRKAPRWNEAEAIRQKNTSRATLEQLHGKDLDAKIDAALDFVAAIDAKHPGLVDLLEANPYLIEDAQVMHQLIEAAEANAARAK